jgi:S1-C subfamily serine protease
MFSEACGLVRESLYGVWGRTTIGDRVYHTPSSGFMISPGVVMTNAHSVHLDGDVTKPVNKELDVIRSPDIGKQAESTTLLGEDTARDLALLRVKNPRSTRCVTLENRVIPSGTLCGSLGFPLPKVLSTPTGPQIVLVERFQGAFISAYVVDNLTGKPLPWYEVDKQIYGGGSGCPGFLENGNVVGIMSRVRDPESESDIPPEKRHHLEISCWIPSPEAMSFARRFGVL